MNEYYEKYIKLKINLMDFRIGIVMSKYGKTGRKMKDLKVRNIFPSYRLMDRHFFLGEQMISLTRSRNKLVRKIFN